MTHAIHDGPTKGLLGRGSLLLSARRFAQRYFEFLESCEKGGGLKSQTSEIGQGKHLEWVVVEGLLFAFFFNREFEPVQ